MGRIGKLIKTAIDKYIEQTVEAYLGANITALTFAASGDDSPPLENDRIALMKIDGSGAFACVGVLTASQGAEPGEKILFSRDGDGNPRAVLKMLGKGEFEFLTLDENGEEKASVKMEKDKLTFKDDNKNEIVCDNSGITVTDKDGGKIEMAGKITMTAKKGASVELDDKITLKDKKGGKIEMDGKITAQGMAGKLEVT